MVACVGSGTKSRQASNLQEGVNKLSIILYFPLIRETAQALHNGVTLLLFLCFLDTKLLIVGSTTNLALGVNA